MPSTQIELLGNDADGVKQVLDRMHREGFVERLWRKDANLWSDDPKVQAAILNRLGWLTVPARMTREIEGLRRLLQDAREDGLTHAVLLGMGGSSLFPEVCRSIFGIQEGGLDMAILDTTDPAMIRAAARRAPAEKTLAIRASKSGSTAETDALGKYFEAEFAKASGERAGSHCVAITDKDTVLQQHAAEAGFRKAFILDDTLGSDVGGRFSALTYFGLVPAALMGIDAGLLLGQGLAMMEECGPNAAPDENPALQLAAAAGALAMQGRNKLTFLIGSPLRSFGLWVEQLVAESTGKNGKGILPVVDEPLRDAGRYADDRLFVEIQLASCIDEPVRAHAQALSNAGHPVLRIEWEDRYDLGGEVVKWSVATALIGALQGENPFDEPNVRQTKAWTQELLQRYADEKRLPADNPLLEADACDLFGSPKAFAAFDGSDPVEALRHFFGLAGDGDYIALLNFLPRTEALDGFAQSLAKALAERANAAVSLEFGPRYLHSTGQLHKGGPDSGIFVVLTAKSPEDLAIPGEAYSFDTLKQAQALGDYQALVETGRRVMRLQLKGDPKPSSAKVLAAVEASLLQKNPMKA